MNSATIPYFICAQCGTLQPRRLTGGKPQRFCSPACRFAYHTSARRGGSVVRDHAERIAAEALALVESVREMYPVSHDLLVTQDDDMEAP